MLIQRALFVFDAMKHNSCLVFVTEPVSVADINSNKRTTKRVMNIETAVVQTGWSIWRGRSYQFQQPDRTWFGYSGLPNQFHIYEFPY